MSRDFFPKAVFPWNPPPFFVGTPGGSISDLSVCVNRFHPEEIVGRVRGSQVFFFSVFFAEVLRMNFLDIPQLLEPSPHCIPVDDIFG